MINETMRNEDAEFSKMNSINRITCLNRSKRRGFYLIRLASVNVFEEWCQRIQKMMSRYQWVMSVYHYSYFMQWFVVFKCFKSELIK